MISDIDHEIAKRIAAKANEVYGDCYRVDWAYIDVRRNFVYNGSDYVARIRNDEVLFDRNMKSEIVARFDISEFLNDGGQ